MTDAPRAGAPHPPEAVATAAGDTRAAGPPDPAHPERPATFVSAPAASAAPDVTADDAGSWPDAFTTRSAAPTDAAGSPPAARSERPVVRVTIGRIDVHPAEPTTSRRARPEPAVTLDDYLRQQR